MANANGFGNSPLGEGAYGYGTPATAPTPGGMVNRDQYGRQLGSLAISTDPATKGRYIFDAYGRRTGMPNVHQLAILAIATIRGTCCVKNLGNEFGEVDKITDSFENEQRARVEDCLKDIVDRKLLRIDKIEIFTIGVRPETIVHTTDLTTMNPIDLAVPTNG